MTTTLAGGRAARRQTMRRIRPRRSPAVPLLLAVWAGAAGVLWLWWRNTPAISDDTGRILGAGRITGLLAGYLMALVVLQMARVPALERRVGSDRVARWHAMTGRYTLCLLVAHVVLIMWGYALQSGRGLGGIAAQTVDSVQRLPDMGKAAAGTGLLVLIGLLSAGPVRRRIPYDAWYHVHLLTYAAVFLTFWHQLTTGNDFAVEPVAKTVWYALYGSVSALVLWYRVLTPLRLNLRHRMRVEAVVEETPGIVSVLIGGRRLHRMGAEAGQFFRWRFLAPGMRFSSHPYSLSAAPRPEMLRITVKAIGDHSSRLRELRPGTRVWAEGPYGALTAQRRSRGKVLLVAGASASPRCGPCSRRCRRRRRHHPALPGHQHPGPGPVGRAGRHRRRARGPADVRGQQPRRGTAGHLRGDPGPQDPGHRPPRRVPVRAARLRAVGLRGTARRGVPARRIHHESFEM